MAGSFAAGGKAVSRHDSLSTYSRISADSRFNKSPTPLSDIKSMKNHDYDEPQHPKWGNGQAKKGLSGIYKNLQHI